MCCASGRHLDALQQIFRNEINYYGFEINQANQLYTEKYFPELISNEPLKKKIIYFSNTKIEKDVFLSLVGFSIDFVESFGFPKKVLDLYFMFNEFGAKFVSIKLDDKNILDFLNRLDAFRRPERLNIF